MSLVCIGSVRGAPGASTLAVLAAACWPRPVALIEADPAGGALAVRYRLGRTPGLAGLASLVRHGADSEVLWQHAQMLPGDLPVVVAPESGEVTAGILRDCAAQMAAWFSQLEDVEMIGECVRLQYRDVHWPLCQGADETLVVARPRAEELYPAAHRLRAMGDDVPSVGMVLIGDRPHSPAEITSQLGVQVRGVVADDAWAAGVLTVGGRSRGLRRSSLVRSVRSLVDDLMYRLETPVLDSGPRAAGALGKATPALTQGPAALPSSPFAGVNMPFTTGGTPVTAAPGPGPGPDYGRGHPGGEGQPIVLPQHTGPISGPTPVTAPVAPAAMSMNHQAPVSVPAAPPPEPEQSPPPTGLPPAYLQRSRGSAARAAEANRRAASAQNPPVQAPPPTAYAPARNAPPPPRPRAGSPRTGGTGVAPARPGNSPASRSRADRTGTRRWGRDK